LWSKTRDSFKILHIVDNKIVNAEALNIFYSDFQKTLNPSDRLAENYSRANFQIESHEMFDALYTEDGQFVACTGILKKPEWPRGMYRLLNRTYFSPLFRKSHSFSFFASDFLLPAQIERCQSPLDFTFVSRQGTNGGHFLKKLQKRPFFYKNYRVSEDYIQVAAGLDEKSFQKILYYKKNPATEFKINSVSSLELLPNGIKETHF
jgi:hypothetical protein